MSEQVAGRRVGREHRRGPVDIEPGRLVTVLALLDQIDRVIVGVAPVLRTVEEMTGLRLAQVGALMAFEANRLAEAQPGMDDLVRSELARRTEPDGTSWELTDQGRTALEQVQGLRIRIVDTVASGLGTEQLGAAAASVGQIADVIERLPPA